MNGASVTYDNKRRKSSVLDRYFRTSPAPTRAMIDLTLWTVSESEWAGKEASYREAIMEQYKIYAEMADRNTGRRGQANTFFLTLNTVIFTALSVYWERPPAAPSAILILPWLVLMGQCLAWFWLLRAYRQLNTAKYAVLGAIEQRLPASPYTGAEWTALGEGRDPARYWPIGKVEQLVPAFFAAAYTTGMVALVLN